MHYTLSMEKFYTYAYLREDRTPYYIGKGCGRRCYSQARHRVKVPSKERIIFLKKNISEADAIKHERYLIAVLGRKDLGTGILRNLTEGGEGTAGWRMPKHMKDAMSVRHKGKSLSPEHLEALRLSNVGRSKSSEEVAAIKAGLNKAITLVAPSGILLTFSSRKDCWSWLGCSRNVLTRLLNGNQYHYKFYEVY